MTSTDPFRQSQARDFRCRLRGSLGEPASRLIDVVARQADSRGQNLYLVGGVVRDLLLGLPGGDLDFTLESDALPFARGLQRTFGGGVLAHKAFGTAKWTLDTQAADTLRLPIDDLPRQIDFARARSETYSEPGALPRVSAGSIAQDMQRRDFSINALALQLSPRESAWRLLDNCGGLDDLRRRRIRVLHKRSFIDDPTRTLRAHRFAARLGFDIEANTAGWMRAAIPLLARVSGARIRNEIELVFDEDNPATVFMALQDCGVLKHIHPALRVSNRLADNLRQVQHDDASWQSDGSDLRWSLLFSGVCEDETRRIAKRLDLTRAQTEAAAATCRILAKRDWLADPNRKPSEIVPLLESASESAIHAAWILLHDAPIARTRLESHSHTWRNMRPLANGHDLLALGLPPGPVYKQLLGRLRDAWLDGEVDSPAAERALLDKLVASLP